MNSLVLKKTFLFFLITLSGICFSYAQQLELSFEYDLAGNQTLRQLICVTCPGGVISITEAEKLGLSAFIKQRDSSSVHRSLKAFPNPLSEVLNLEWNSNSGIFIKSIAVYALNGITVFRGEYTRQQTSTSIPFAQQVPGGYLVQAVYSDGKKQVLKVIKQ